jgi:hypothetical protein
MRAQRPAAGTIPRRRGGDAPLSFVARVALVDEDDDVWCVGCFNDWYDETTARTTARPIE